MVVTRQSAHRNAIYSPVFLSKRNFSSAHSCITLPHRVIQNTNPLPSNDKTTPSISQFTSGIATSTECHSQIVNVQPTPITLTRGTTAALLPAEHKYWRIYFPLITSDRRSGIASITCQ